MRVLGGFFVKSGDRVRLNVSGITGGVEAYVGVMKRFDEDGGGHDARWLPSELTSAQGGTAPIGNVHGENVMIVPVINKDGKMKVRLRVTGSVNEDRSAEVSMNNNEPFGWRLFVD